MFSPLQLLSASDDMSFVFMMFMNVYVEVLPFLWLCLLLHLTRRNEAKEIKKMEINYEGL